MFCNNCGKRISDNAIRCDGCGTPVNSKIRVRTDIPRADSIGCQYDEAYWNARREKYTDINNTYYRMPLENANHRSMGYTACPYYENCIKKNIFDSSSMIMTILMGVLTAVVTISMVSMVFLMLIK